MLNKKINYYYLAQGLFLIRCSINSPLRPSPGDLPAGRPGSPVSTLLVRGLSGDSKPEGLFPSFRATTSRVPTYLAGPQLSPALTTHLLPAWLDCCVCDSHRWEWHLPCLHPFFPSRDPALLTSCVCSTLSLMDPRQRRLQPSTPACRICSGRCGAEPSGPPRFSHLLHTSPPSFCPGT